MKTLTNEEATCIICELQPSSPQDAIWIDDNPSAIALRDRLIVRGYLVTERRHWKTIDETYEWEHSATFYVVTPLGRRALECYFAAKALGCIPA